MEDSTNRTRTVYISGLVGIISVIFTIISDLILLGRRESGYSFFLMPTECMTWIPSWRITLGTFLGVFMLPFQIAGLVPMYIGLRPSGKAVPAVTGLAGAHGLIMGVAFHTTYAFLAGGWKLYHSANGGLSAGEEGAGPSALMDDFQFYWRLIIVIMAIDLILLSILYIITVLKGRTLFPKWMAALNPAAIMTVIVLIMLAAPVPVGGYAAPTMLNLSALIFFIVSASVVCRKLKNEAARV